MLKYIKICKCCGNTFETNNKYVIECPFCSEQSGKSKVGEYLRMLSELGWSDLIDSRWERDVVKTIKGHYSNAKEEDIQEVLKLVIYEG